MKARLIKDIEGNVKLLCGNGTICDSSLSVLANLFTGFRYALDFSGNDGKWSSAYGDMALYPGQTLAYVTDDFNLVCIDSSVFEPLIADTFKVKSLIPLSEYAKQVDKSAEIVKVLCRSGRIVGAQKMAGRWMVPKDAPYPIPPERQRVSWRDKK